MEGLKKKNFRNGGRLYILIDKKYRYLAPDAARGCPRAIAPPQVLSFSMGTSSAFWQARVWAAKASLISIWSISPREMPVFSNMAPVKRPHETTETRFRVEYFCVWQSPYGWTKLWGYMYFPTFSCIFFPQIVNRSIFFLRLIVLKLACENLHAWQNVTSFENSDLSGAVL